VSNGGTVTSTSFTSYIGLAAGSVGAATVTGPGSHLFVASNALFFSDTGNGTLTIATGGAASVSGNVGLQAGSVGNIGAGTGAAAAAPGTLDSPSVFFGSGTGAINFNHTSTGYTFRYSGHCRLKLYIASGPFCANRRH
jgi:T5SS/PEP-CTERM-associated repeat protein